MTVDGDGRFDRIEAVLETLVTTVRSMADSTAHGLETTTAMMRVLDARMVVLEGQMTEVVGRLRIIGEQLATHLHDHGEAA